MSPSDLLGKTMIELLEIYNSNLEPGEERRTLPFRDKSAAIAKIIRRGSRVLATTEVKPVTEPVLKDGKLKTRRRLINLPFSGRIRGCRSGSKREQVIALLREGASREEIMERFNWDHKTAHEQIYLTHVYQGYGLREAEDGKIYLLDREPCSSSPSV